MPVSKPEHARGHLLVPAEGNQLRNAGQLRLEEKGEKMSIDEAHWEFEPLHVSQFVAEGRRLESCASSRRPTGRWLTRCRCSSGVLLTDMPLSGPSVGRRLGP